MPHTAALEVSSTSEQSGALSASAEMLSLQAPLMLLSASAV